MNNQLIPVPFYEDINVLVDHDGKPFVAMKPIVENMGLDWKSQHVKLTSKFDSVMVIITTTGIDGKQYEMVCLPLRKLPAFLYSVNPNKVAPDLRDKIIRYQDECDEVLWKYWTTGFAARPGISQPTFGQQLAAHGIRLRLADKLETETHPVKRRLIHEQLNQISQMLGLSTPAIDSIGRDAIPDYENPLLEEFWEGIDSLQHGANKLNHSRNIELIAINLPEVYKTAKADNLTLPDKNDMRRLLHSCRQPRFVAIKTVNSALTEGSLKCWVFNSDASEGHTTDLFVEQLGAKE